MAWLGFPIDRNQKIDPPLDWRKERRYRGPNAILCISGPGFINMSSTCVSRSDIEKRTRRIADIFSVEIQH